MVQLYPVTLSREITAVQPYLVTVFESENAVNIIIAAQGVLEHP